MYRRKVRTQNRRHFRLDEEAPLISTQDRCKNCQSTNAKVIKKHPLGASNPQKSSYVLVVGGLGYIGSHTVWLLLQSGEHNVIIVDDLSNSSIRVLNSLQTLRDRLYNGSPHRPRIDFYEADYCDQDRMGTILSYYHSTSDPVWPHGRCSWESRGRIAGVYQFAAFKAVNESFHKPLEYYANNVSGLVHFCKTLNQFGVKTLIYSSSATVYGTSDGPYRFTEKHCDNGGCQGLTNPYGRTKWMSEAILTDLAASDPTWTIVALRYFNPVGCDESGLLGEDPSGPPSNLMPLVVKAMTHQSQAVHIYGTDWDTPDGTAIRDYIHVSDLADGHVKALRGIEQSKVGSGFHVFNLGTGVGHSVKEVISTMEHISGKSITVLEDQRRLGDVCTCVADVARARSVLGWKARRSVAKACEDICRRLSISTVQANQPLKFIRR